MDAAIVGGRGTSTLIVGDCGSNEAVRCAVESFEGSPELPRGGGGGGGGGNGERASCVICLVGAVFEAAPLAVIRSIAE